MENILHLEHEIAKIQAAQAAADEQHKTIFRRLDKQDERLDKQGEMIESVRKLATSVERLTLKQDGTEKKLDGLCQDVDEIKAKPGRRWEGLVQNLLYAFGGALVAYVVARLGLG